jgi:UDP-N-acetylglucosamine 2-epimerase (non-hydrolysing)
MKITLVAGARPNFMKIAPIIRAIEEAQASGHAIEYRLVHTGQHYDGALSQIFFDELSIPPPDVNLGAGSGTQAEQTGRIMIEFERDLAANPCDWVVVVGDVNSTLACTIVAKKMNTRVAHVEGGIRSFDMAMPEEINRIVTDSLADSFFTTSGVANENLRKAGVSEDRIFFVGNTMIDCLLTQLPRIKKPAIFDELHLSPGSFMVLTLHRPTNVDDPAKFRNLIGIIDKHAGRPLVFPMHPRTEKNFRALPEHPRFVYPCRALGYLEFIYLVKNAFAAVTDSGGIQEETTVLGVPCMTLRSSTERPETVDVGTNELIGDDETLMIKAFATLERGAWKKGAIPDRWDGQAARRIVAQLLKTAH